MILQCVHRPSQLAARRKVLFASGFQTPTGHEQRRGSHSVRTDCSGLRGVGVGRTAVLTKIDNFRQGMAHPRVDPTNREDLYLFPWEWEFSKTLV